MPDTLAQRIKAKYPGQYDDLSDQDLETKIVAKYPGVYDDIPKTIAASTSPTTTEPAKGRDVKVLGVNIHMAPDNPRLDSNMLGFGTQDPSRPEEAHGIAPEDALMIAQALKRVGSAGAGLVPKLLAGAREASPMVKYELVKGGLQSVGIPSPIAAVVAMGVSGYRRSATPAAAETAAAETVRPSPSANATGTSMTPGPVLVPRPAAAPVEPVPAEATAPVVTEPTPAPAARPKSPQQLLNEEAIARRRAAMQRPAAPVVEAPPEAAMSPAKPSISAEETKVYLQLRKQGVPDAQAREGIIAARALNERFGLSTPTQAETEFPKGQRGKLTEKPPLTEAQQAAAQPKPAPGENYMQWSPILNKPWGVHEPGGKIIRRFETAEAAQKFLDDLSASTKTPEGFANRPRLKES